MHTMPTHPHLPIHPPTSTPTHPQKCCRLSLYWHLCMPVRCILLAPWYFAFNRSIVAIINWIRFIFTTEQKKTDFKPEEDAPMQMVSPVSLTCLLSSGVALTQTDSHHCTRSFVVVVFPSWALWGSFSIHRCTLTDSFHGVRGLCMSISILTNINTWRSFHPN